MPDLSQIVRSFAQKQGEARATADIKRQSTGYQSGVRGSVLPTLNQQTTTFQSILDGTAEAPRASMEGYGQFLQDSDVNRTSGEFTRDTLLGVTGGVVGSVGGLAQLGVSAATAPVRSAVELTTGREAIDPGVYVGMGVNALQDKIREGYSEDFQGAQAVYDAQGQYTDQLNREIEARRITDGWNPIAAGATRILGDGGMAVNRLLVNGAVGSDVVAQGGGSLLVGGPVAKLGAGAVGLAARGLAARGLISASAAATIAAGAEGGAMATVITGMEAGGAYGDAANRVVQMTPEQLSENSPKYRQMIADGYDPDIAKLVIAGDAGTVAATIQAPVAAVTGKMVEGFERMPMRVGGIREGLMNIGKETVEEAVQSGSGALASNLGLRWSGADTTADVLQGVGQGIVEGAVGGLGSAVAISGPSLAVNTAVRGTKAAVDGVKSGITGIQELGAKRIEALEGTNTNSIAQRTNEQLFVQPGEQEAVQVAVREMAEAQNIEPAKMSALDNAVNSVFEAARFIPSEIEASSPLVQEVVGEPATIFDGMRNVAIKILKDETTTDMQKAELGLYLNSVLTANQELVDDAVPTIMEFLPEDHPAYAKVRGFQTAISTIRNHPQLVKAMEAGIEAARAQATPESVSDANINTPAGDIAVGVTLRDAKYEPDKVNPDVADLIMKHASSGTLNINPQNLALLKSSLSLVKTLREAADVYKQLGNGSTANVAAEIQISQQPGNKGFSASNYTQSINEAMARGDTDIAADLLSEMKLFAEHLSNKTAAVNQSYGLRNTQRDTSVPFKALNSKTREWFEDRFYVQAGAVKSVTTAQQIGVDAKAVADIYNSLVDTFPELGQQHFVPVSLAPELMSGTATELANAHRKQPKEDKVQEKVQQTEAEPEQNPVELTEEKVPSNQQAEEPVVEAEAEASTTVSEAVEDVAAQPATDDGPEVTVVEDESNQPTAEIEQVSEPEVVDHFANLIEGKSGNFFKKSFKVPEKQNSRLFGLPNAYRSVADALKSGTAFEAFTGKPTSKLPVATADAYTELMKLGPQVAVRMQARVKDLFETGKDGKPSMAARLQSDDVLSWIAGKAANLLIQKEDGSYAYHPQLLQQSILAGMNWMLNAMNRDGNQDAEQIAKVLGVDESQVTDTDVSAFNAGIYEAMAIESLAKDIKAFWGVVDDANQYVGFTDGIPQAIAAEIMAVLASSSYVSRVSVDAGERTFWQLQLNAKVLPGVEVDVDGRMTKASPLLSFPDAIAAAVLVEREQYLPEVGQEPTDVAQTQLHNSVVDNTAEQKAVIQKVQSVPSFFNLPMLDFVRQVGRVGMTKFAGEGLLEERLLNVNHKRSLEGRNTAAVSAYDNLMALVDNVEAVADGGPLNEVPVYYRYNMTRVNRLQQLGSYGTQASKLVREVLLPNVSVRDLSDSEGKPYENYMRGLAQALGIKIHKMPVESWMPQLEGQLEGQYADVLSKLADWAADRSVPLSEEIVDDVIFAMGGDSRKSMAGLHALVDYANFLSSSFEERKAYQTSIYVEADGVTNGPMGAMWHMAVGQFTPEWVKNIAKGGILFTSKATPLYEQIARDKNDLYQETANAVQRFMNDLQMEIKREAPALKENFEAVRDVLTTLMAEDIRYENGVLTIDRGVTKNPLTITIYGSSANGIAGKVTKELVDILYERVSASMTRETENGIPWNEAFFADRSSSPEQAKAKYDRFWASMDVLMNTAPGRSKMGKLFNKKNPLSANEAQFGNPEAFTLNPKAVQNMQSNILYLFVDPMSQAIESEMGSAMQGAGIVQRATAMMSEYSRARIMSEIDAELPQDRFKRTGVRLSDFLSKKKLADIRRKAEHLAPFIRTDTQNYLIGSNEAMTNVYSQTDKQGNTRRKAVEIASGFDDTFASRGATRGQASAGVSGIPYLNIGFTDGQMIQTAVGNIKGGFLPIFDGINLSQSSLEEDALAVNRSVSEAWLNNNPIIALNEAFQSFLKDVNVDGLVTEDIKAIERAYGLPKDALSGSPKVAMEYIQRMGEQLQSASEEVQARIETLKTVNISWDQMAAVDAPYVSTGSENTDLSGLSDTEIANELTMIYNEKLAKIRSSDTKGQEQKNVSFELWANAETDEASGAKVMEARHVLGLMNSVKVPTIQKDIVKRAVHAISGMSYKLVYGSTSSLAKYAFARGFPVSFNAKPGEQIHGMTSVKDKVIFVTTGETETIAHELLHAATLETVLTAYSDPQSLNPETVKAVKRLELLMLEWLENEKDIVSLRGAAAKQAFLDAKTAVNGFLYNRHIPYASRRAAALNEFMAWNLSNQELVRVNRATSVRTQLAKIAKDALEALKAMFWPRNAPSLDNSMFSNIRFNTAIVLEQTIPNVSDELLDMALMHSTQENASERLDRIREAFAVKVKQIEETAVTPVAARVRAYEAAEDYRKAVDLTDMVEAAGFPMTAQERSTFIGMLVAFIADADLNPNAFRGLDTLHREVLAQLKVTDLMADPNSTNPNDTYRAQQQFDLLTGATDLGKDRKGRSLILPVFVALGAVHENLRSQLSQMEVKHNRKRQWDTVDNALTSASNEIMDRLVDLTSGARVTDKTVGDMLTRMVDALGMNTQNDRVEQANNVLNKVSDIVNFANDKLTDGIAVGVDKSIAVIDNLKAQAQGKPYEKAAELTANVTKLMLAAASKDRASEVETGIMANINSSELAKPLRDLMGEIVGMTDENAPVLEMVKMVRTMIQQTRQQFREQLPRLILSKFSRKLTKDEVAHLTFGLAKTDMSVFSNRSISAQEILNIVGNDNVLQRETARLEQSINQMQPKYAAALMRKATETADFMVNGKVPSNLLRNGRAVANLFGEPDRKDISPDEATVQAVDELISIYALKMLPADTKKSLSSLVQSEPEGMAFAMSYLIGQRKDEAGKPQGVAMVNHFKGHVPTTRKGTLTVAPLAQAGNMKLKGFTMVGLYQGSADDTSNEARGYFYSDAKLPQFQQGVLQDVRPTVFGVDTTMGYRSDGLGAGMIADPDKVKRIERSIAKHAKMGQVAEPLMPHYNEAGQVIAYERSMSEQMINDYAVPEHNLPQSLGMWRGRQVEEAMADVFNVEVLKRVKAMSDAERANNPERFIDLLNTTDPVYKDAAKLLSPTARQFINDEMNGELWTRKDVADNLVGYRAASVGDVWTGNTRLSKNTQEQLRNVLTGVFGVEAYQRLTKAETAWANVMSDARVLIVVKSVIVPAANLLSNVYQLMSRGVPLHTMVQSMPQKTAEVSTFLKGQQRRVELEADLRVAESANNIVETRKIRTQLQTLRDANRRMSIWPLIEAGEFSSISEGLTEDDLNLTQGKLWQYIQEKVDALPQAVKTAGRYALLTKDTALFQGLAKSVAYSDFIAKAVLYDHLTKTKKQDSKTAMRAISNEFVNYDILPGRTRSYLEKTGMIWFWNYKLRILKIAAATIRENPLHMVMTAALPAPDFVGYTWDDNFVAKLFAGNLGNSVGIGQALRSWHLHPWMQLTS